MSKAPEAITPLKAELPKKLDLKLSEEQQKFLAKVIEISGQNVNLCFQCKKCSAGCPVLATGAMDITPTQVIHLIRLGQVEPVLNSHTVWVCASCETCTTRCPQGVDIAKVIDASRNYAKQLGKIAEDQINIFLDAFMKSIEKHGRLYEMGLAINIKMKTKEWMRDRKLGADMFMKGKLKVFPHNTKNAKEVREMLQKIKEMDSK